MLLQSLHIENFRRFDRIECEFHPRLTLLIGVNGAGKSSLLKALSIGLGDMASRTGMCLLPKLFASTDVRRVDSLDAGGRQWRAPVFPSRIKLQFEAFGESHVHQSQRANLHDETTPPDHEEGSVYGRMRAWFGEAHPGPVPVLARYGAHAATTLTPTAGVSLPPDAKHQIWDQLSTDMIDGAALIEWFHQNELQAFQEGCLPAICDAVKSAVLSAIHLRDIRYVARAREVMVDHAGAGWRPFSELSDGQRRLASLFLDLAIRAASLNSHLGADCLREARGIVLIDEVDLHLHPQWQRSVIDGLLSVFPNMQFVIASHSPFLIQSALEHGVVLDASTGEPAYPTGTSIEDIAETVMGVELPQRSRRFVELRKRAQEYLELMETPTSTEGERAALRRRLDASLSAFSKDPASSAWLQMQSMAKGL